MAVCSTDDPANDQGSSRTVPANREDTGTEKVKRGKTVWNKQTTGVFNSKLLFACNFNHTMTIILVWQKVMTVKSLLNSVKFLTLTMQK